MLTIANKKSFNRKAIQSFTCTVFCFTALPVTHSSALLLARAGLAIAFLSLLCSLAVIFLARREGVRIQSEPEYEEAKPSLAVAPLIKACEMSPSIQRTVDSFVGEPLTEEIANSPKLFEDRQKRLSIRSEGSRQNSIICAVLSLDTLAVFWLMLESVRLIP